MFEAHVLHLLRKYLGEYVHGLSSEALRISVWKGDVVLKDLKLKAEALNSLKLPVTVTAGFIGTITLKVPWKSLGKEPVIVLIDRVFILAHPAPDGQSLKDEDRERLFEAKLRQIEEAELATLEATSRGSKSGNPSGGSSWLSSLIATIIGNLKITISNVHVRYEDSLSNPGHPFSSGVTLAKLAAVTTDEHGNETFDTSGALDRLRKSLYLQRLALYHDSDSSPWMLQKKWEELSPMEWVEIFADGINKSDGDKDFSSREKHRKYLVSPINGVLNYHRLGKQENHDPDVPLEKAALVLTDVSLTILETQYYDVIKLLETLSRYKTRVNVSHLRPVEPLSQNTYLWWRYAVQATLQQKKMCYRFSWERIRQLCHLRRRYVQLYATSLQLCTKEDNYQIRQIEKDLDSKVILLWRLLAHAKVESVKSKEASQQSGVLKRSWWSFGWHTASDDASIPYSPSGEQFSEEKLSKEEWQVLNKMLSYDPDEDNIPISGKVMQTMIQFLVDISIEKAAARIVSIDQMEVLYGRFEQLRITTRFYYKSIHCELSLRYCGLSSPEGSLAQSVSNEKKENALAATFVHSPVGDKVDWSLSATIAPCHVTVFMKSYERFLGFMKRSNAVSPTVALETAAALQMKIEQVTRKAQEQFQMVLEEQSRFNLDIDFDAPKVRVPFGDCSSGSSHGNFLLDFGHFTLHTREDEHDERRESIYSRFTIFGKDIAAFFSDGCSEDCRHSSTHTLDDQHSILCTHSDNNDFHSLIDRCRMSVVVDQIKVPHPSYPSTRISIEVPKLGIHFSPTRYQRFFDLLDIFYGSVEVSDQEISAELMHPDLAPWYPADLASEARVLVWRGIGNSLAEWRPCFLVLSGLYLYVLESEISQSYQRCCSMGGRSVFEVPPASVGGSFFSVAVSLRGSDVQKALESSSTLIIEFRNEVEKTKWLKGLIQATYQASAFPLVDVPGKLRNDIDDAPIPSNAFQRADLVINGSLFEAKLSIYGKFARNEKCPKEELIVDILAGGGKVNLARTSSDLSLKLKLHFLKIRDELQGQNSVFSQYLACSVVKHNFCPDNSALSLCDEMLPKNLVEEDDIFRDALPNFVSAVHQNFDDQPLDIIGDSFSGALDECELCSHHNFRDDIHCDNTKCRGKLANAEVFYEAEDDGSSDFVVLTFFSRYPDSPLYDGIDTQMSICMSKLDFFCNRPTVVALLDFGFDLSLVNSSIKSTNSIDDKVAHSSNDRERAEDSGRSVVKGLLGYGKRRIVFYLRMAVDSVCVFLNKEDGSQFAMFVQERFLFDFKVHPSSTSLKSTLGNFRLCDMSLGPDHCWGWLCDVRDHRSESLIKFTFRSFSADDDDYTGHDYSLSGELSAVRIVFLYRFVQEVMAYFMELATPHTEEVIKFVDKVGGFEWLIKKYEIDGASSIKLDLSLDTPVIVVPYSSMSQSFMQFDLGKLQITNSLRWHGEEKDPSAVHLDILHAEMRGINLAVGVNGEIGEPMIEEGQQLQIEVRRSLRDIFRKVPMACVEVKVGSLHCVMSDKEYRIIRDCAYTNISEIPSLPPTFRGNTNATDSIRMLADKVNFNTQILLSRTVVIMAVHVQHALLELRNGRYEESPLAQIVLEGLWVSYRSTSLSEADLYVTIPKFSILDIRPDIKPEMRSMLGSSSDAYKQGVFSSQLDEPSSWTCSDVFPSNAGEGTGSDIPNLTMLIMDYRWRPSSQSFVIRMQQPRVLVVLDFLVSVAEFFVPSLRSITGSEELVDPKNDPLSRTDNIIVSEPLYMQKADIIHLSPARKLIVDGPGFDEVIYDGCGGTIHVSEECETYDHELSGYCKLPFSIIVGRGKMLRFKNVKIENGTLLSKHTYLGNDSSYSVSAEDGVQISLPDNFSADVRHTNSQNLQSLSECRDVKTVNSDVNSAELQSFSFEAQVVSPELTFYDSSGVFLEDAMHVEKLLRAKMDFNFMYASKGNDIWVRSHVKDFAIESGSGLTVLAPLDISGGYTSVKDKANISIISTDVCIHLSLSVASLILRLQHQAFTALQFGNMDPVTSCTNFKRIWVSQEGNKFGYNLTFWRPQAPLNYAILGDCVTSRPIPPSQIVMAVSNSYGRVRKPIGFKLIGLISDLLVPDGGESQTDVSSDCSIWMPIAPPGYLALGCVAHVGRHPPPNHAVYCIRSDLVTSATFSDCIINIPSNNRAPSGFSIWRVYNAACSFYAHSLVGCPSTSSIFDLHHILLGDISLSSLTNTNKSTYNQSDLPGDGVQLGNEYTNTISRWDILRAFSKPGSCYISTPHFERVWWDKGCDFRKGVSFWRPLPRQGFCVLGDFLAEGLEPPTLGILFKCDSPEISAKPMQFTKVAHVTRKGLDDAYFWYPIPPPGYASLGCVLTKTDEPPCKESVCCPRMDLVSEANISEYPLFKSSSSKGSNCWSVWKIENQANTFLARPDHKRPSSRLAYALSDYVKPKSRENISAEMKIGTLSLTIIDGLCGMMTPLFDLTITSINLATHGQFEAMNAALICSVAASTFNRQLETWEPLVEPFEGIFKVETYDTNENALARVGKRIRIAATSIVNLNLSAGNLETLAESVVSWRKQADLEQKTMRKSDESNGCQDSTFSALDEDDFEKVILENKLGCDLYLKKVVEGSDTVVLLSHGNEASVSIPPPRFSDRLNVITETRANRSYVAINIFHAKGLPIEDDGNGLDFFCALRLVIDGKTSNRSRLFPQSARTRCVKPLISKINDTDVGIARWNEIFLFEVPDKVLATLELEITNLASKTGKGEVVGALSIPVRKNVSTLKRISSIRMMLDLAGSGQQSSYPLKRRGQVSGKIQDCGCLYASTAIFERSSVSNFHGGAGSSPYLSNKEVGFWVGLCPEGPWESFGSLLPLSVSPKLFDEKPFAFEVTMRNGCKHAIFRPLALIVNDANVKLEVSLCPASTMGCAQSEMRNNNLVGMEEIFENQWYHPTSGWGSKWTGHQSRDPANWSTRDFSYSSKDYFNIPLPPGWRWTSAWTIEKTELMDSDGWAYGTDFQSLTWPPSSSKSHSKSPQDFVRRRRWIRTREQLSKESTENARNIIAIVSPGSSAPLPWSSMTMDLNLCLQIRPYDETSGIHYSWGEMFSITPTYNCTSNENFDQSPFSRQNTIRSDNFRLSPSALTLNQLGKMDFLLCCDSSVSKMQHFWLTVGTDASVLQTEVNVPVYDWKITINSPLKVENKLPYPAEFYIWEKTVEGNNVERQYGIVPSGNSFYVYSADLQKPIYLTLFIQNDWAMEKDAVLIMDLLCYKHSSSFWMVNKQSKRRLRVSVEHDIEGTIATPKTIRLFVPYWIQNNSSVPLSYRIVEVEYSENGDVDAPSISKAVKSAKSVLRHTSSSLGSSRRFDQILEVIEEPNSPYIMLSPQDYSNHIAISHHQSHNELLPSQHIGISVAVCHSECYGPGISLYELENKERVDIKAFASSGSYYKLSAMLSVTSDRTKVVCFQPQTLFINRIGCNICLKQSDNELVEWLHPMDVPKLFKWQSGVRTELLKLRMNGCKWSSPFSVGTEGLMCISLMKDGDELTYLWIEVRSSVEGSRYEVIFRPVSFSSPYRIENRSLFLNILFRQVDCHGDFWRSLPQNSSTSFCWEDLGRRQLLEILVEGSDPSKSEIYNIDNCRTYQPVQMYGGPMMAIRVSIFKDGKMHVVRIDDWRRESQDPAVDRSSPAPYPQSSEYDSTTNFHPEFHVTLELAELGLSIIDHTPEEILYLSVQNLLLSYSTGLGSGVSRFKLRIVGLQVDNQLPFTPMPVLFRSQRIGEVVDDYVLKFSLTMQSSSQDLCMYPYIGIQGPENSAFLVNIHEPIIWRLHEMIKQGKLSRMYSPQSYAVPIDPTVQIRLLNISEFRFKLSMSMSPNQRPGGVLGFWSSLMTALGNMENMTVRINQRSRENVCMRQSTLVSTARSSIRKDLLSQPLRLLSGVDILGNASSALGHMSKGVAALSMDKKFIQSRQKQESKTVEDFGDVIREGGGALAKGLFRGVTGILTKPLEGAKSSGVEGFVQGVGKGIIGVAAQPVSGVLDLLSKTTEGANAMRMKIASTITSEEQLRRRRLPRAIGGDSLLKPYDEYKATGLAILQLAESGTFFGQVDFFKVRGKFALSDAYEDHFLLPKGKIILVTHRRVLQLQQPTNIVGQRKFNPARDPCSVLWDVLWDDLMTRELAYGNKDPPTSPSRLILYPRMRPTESRENIRVIKCRKESQQANEIYASIERAMNIYGPNRQKEMRRENVTKPYTPCTSAENARLIRNEASSAPAIPEVPSSISMSSSFGTVNPLNS